ncbi:MAG: PDR/VanB family oxidoreductase [Hyphomicrobiaceae bacterium]|nr:PDR/VanB family oxidoreductase [Hyphomicrobiaceae bacterium]
MTHLALVVAKVKTETDLIRRIWIKRPDGGVLPGYTAGAHITLTVPGVGVRKYSLINASAAPGATEAPTEYQIGVRLEEKSEGGSRYVHGLKAGDAVEIEPPANAFACVPGPGGTVLIGGGIGITPMLSMAAELMAKGLPFKLAYAARSQQDMAFGDEIRALCGDGLHLHLDQPGGKVFDMAGFLGSLPPETTVYVCGPKPMIKAAIDGGRKLGWPAGRVKFELFFSVKGPEPAAKPGLPEGAFEVVLKSSGKTLLVARDKSILDVLIEAGADVLSDCRKGECGVCQVGVIEGTPEHKDVILSDAERAAGKLIQVCVSRSKSPRLVLDL